mmetsp:Transcript_12665/g.35023  ORF Transcript_12665/g.35023 Transcript_12665/m.35023 type:complete len:218 (-) Transcript_12665:368-1021(-)
MLFLSSPATGVVLSGSFCFEGSPNPKWRSLFIEEVWRRLSMKLPSGTMKLWLHAVMLNREQGRRRKKMHNEKLNQLRVDTRKLSASGKKRRSMQSGSRSEPNRRLKMPPERTKRHCSCAWLPRKRREKKRWKLRLVQQLKKPAVRKPWLSRFPRKASRWSTKLNSPPHLNIRDLRRRHMLLPWTILCKTLVQFDSTPRRRLLSKQMRQLASTLSSSD